MNRGMSWSRVSSAWFGVAMLVSCAATAAEKGVRIELLDASGAVVASQEAKDGAATLAFERTYQPGDRIRVVGPTLMAVRLADRMRECLVCAPDGVAEYPIPSGKELRVYAREWFAGIEHTATARPATADELAAERNLALNPYDVRGKTTFFPHATSNSECRNEPDFAARNAIDGETSNRRHGAWPVQSWGPDKRKDLWWKVEFGRPVELERVGLVIRADFPHDRHWHHAVIEFSDGTREPVEIKKTAEKQTFAFTKRTATWLRFTDLVQDEPLGWCAFTEVEAWGGEAKPAEGK